MSYRIALASSNGKQVDLHFGHTGSFYIIEVDAETGAWALVEQRDLPEAVAGPAPGGQGGCSGHNDERLNRVIGILPDCRYLL
ncbi:MAG: hypothetical protein LBL28_08515, partial [Treponema sp.]|nr:hypothetical protein [Treponema sp.]